MTISAMKATDSAIVAAAACRPWELAMATTTARMLHAVTSSTAAQVIAVLPSTVPVMPRSAMIRARTGNAVMLMAMPMKSAKARKLTPSGAKSGYSNSERRTPRKYGTTMPVLLTTTAVWAWLDRSERSSSRPTNRKRTTPISAKSLSAGRDEAVKRNWYASGAAAPRTEGPSTSPATISPTTAGW